MQIFRMMKQRTLENYDCIVFCFTPRDEVTTAAAVIADALIGGTILLIQNS
jgi:hypothetical protein